jgi:hypothetical protein
MVEEKVFDTCSRIEEIISMGFVLLDSNEELVSMEEDFMDLIEENHKGLLERIQFVKDKIHYDMYGFYSKE